MYACVPCFLLPSSILQIKNAVRAAHALAPLDEAPVSYSYLETVPELGEEFECDFNGPRRVASPSSYS